MRGLTIIGETDGKIKYKCLPELVKSALILPHGNADVERSLSVNTSVVTEDRSHIGEATVCAIRTVMNAVEFFDPVSNLKKFASQESSLESAKMAFASYRQKLDRDKEEKELETAETTGAGESWKERLEREREEEDKRTTSLQDKEKEL